MAGRGEWKLWTEEETVLALFLYFQLPFGKLDQRTAEVKDLAKALGRKDGSVAMKLANFASLDPKIVGSGRRGLDGSSKLDRATYARFGEDWSGLVVHAEKLWQERVGETVEPPVSLRLQDKAADFGFELFMGGSEVETLKVQRIGQGFFRRAVLANYDEVCCVTGISEPRVLIASHIKPWKDDSLNRHNPSNGLLLSATMDKAFDCGLMTITREGRVKMSRELTGSKSTATADFFAEFDGSVIRSARRFDPDPSFLDWHNRCHFVDGPLAA